MFFWQVEAYSQNTKPRIIVTSDGEIDDQCSMIRFLLYANHPPVIRLNHAVDLTAKPGETVKLNAKGTSDPDGDNLNIRCQYTEADTYQGSVEIKGSTKKNASKGFQIYSK